MAYEKNDDSLGEFLTLGAAVIGGLVAIDKSAKLDQEQAKSARLGTELTTQAEQLSLTKNALSATAAELAKTQAVLADTTTQLTNASRTIEVLREQKQDLSDEVDALHAESNRLSNDLTRATEQITRLETDRRATDERSRARIVQLEEYLRRNGHEVPVPNS